MDRGCEDMYEVLQPEIELNTKIVMLINVDNQSRQCQIFYRVSYPKNSDWVEGFAVHPPGELVERDP